MFGKSWLFFDIQKSICFHSRKKKNYKQVSKSDPDHGRINCKSAAAENHTEKQSTEKGEHSSKFTMAPQNHTVNLVPVETW